MSVWGSLWLGLLARTTLFAFYEESRFGGFYVLAVAASVAGAALAWRHIQRVRTLSHVPGQLLFETWLCAYVTATSVPYFLWSSAVVGADYSHYGNVSRQDAFGAAFSMLVFAETPLSHPALLCRFIQLGLVAWAVVVTWPRAIAYES